jgi:hypothetical protein
MMDSCGSKRNCRTFTASSAEMRNGEGGMRKKKVEETGFIQLKALETLKTFKALFLIVDSPFG